jgi:hypothetical protein
MTRQTRTRDEIYAAHKIDPGAPTAALLRALTDAVQRASGVTRDAIELNVEHDVRAEAARFQSGDLDLLAGTPWKEKIAAASRAKWTATARSVHEAADALLAEVAGDVRERAEAQRRFAPDFGPKSDRVAHLLGQLLAGQDTDRAERFLASHTGAAVQRRYAAASDADDPHFVRAVERAVLAGDLELRETDAATALSLARALGDAVRARREARVGEAERAALDTLPKLKADLDRALVAIEPTPAAAGRVLHALGKPGTVPTRADRDAAAREDVAAREAQVTAARLAAERTAAEQAAAHLRG